DGSIALYRPHVAVLNNVSLDHLPMETLIALFGAFIARAGKAVINLDNGEGALLAATMPRERLLTFAIGATADLTAINLREQRYGIAFE
ncbi:UDP-N-acetylmuramate--alanine ligase, partial [Escherichia coli]|nr:UDP-N-acetylmuramate--alanine ligase [Escherichia coli]